VVLRHHRCSDRLALDRDQAVRDRHLHQGIALRVYRCRVEPYGRLRQATLFGSRRVFRPGSIHLDDSADFGSGISPWIGILAGGVVAMLASLPIGALCFRLRGPYFAIATIATAQVLMLLFLKFRDFAWGAEGTTLPNLGNSPLMMQFGAKAAYYYIALAMLASALRSPIASSVSWMGYYLVAVGEDEDAAEAIGVNAPRIKRNVYLISAFLTALAGTFYVRTSTSSIEHRVQLQRLRRSGVGIDRRGIGTLWGPVVGTALLEPTSALLQSSLGSGHGGVQLTVYAVILIAVIPMAANRTRGTFYGCVCTHLSYCADSRKRSIPRCLNCSSLETSARGSAVCEPSRTSVFRLGKAKRLRSSGPTEPARRRASISSPATIGPTAGSIRAFGRELVGMAPV